MAKRATDAATEGSSKRARAMGDDLYEVKLGNVTYVILEKLHSKYKKYFEKNKQRYPAALSDGREVFFVSRDNVNVGRFKLNDKYSSKRDYRLVYKSAIDDLIAAAEAGSLPRAPRVIAEKDLRFFVDPQTHTSYEVEMRGERTKEGIFFKAKDVGRVFKVESFCKIVVDPRKSFTEGRDYVWFAVHDPQLATATPHSAQQKVDFGDISLGTDSDTPRQGPRRELFLTFGGLLHAIHVSHSPIASTFRDWVETAVFTFTYGTKEQKEGFLSALSKTDKVTWKIMSKITHQIMCIYLLETPKRDGDAKVYKFGKAEHFRERFLDHLRDYGDGIQLEHLVLVPADKLYDAETTLKKSLMEHSKFRLNNKLEEISLNAAELEVVRTIMQTISDRFVGQSLVISTRYEMLMLNKEREVAVLTEKLASAEKLLASMEKTHANQISIMKEAHGDKLTSVKALHAETVVSMEAIHAETLKCARETLASVQEKLASVEAMYQDRLVKVEEICRLRLQLVDLEKRALQVEVNNLKLLLKQRTP